MAIQAPANRVVTLVLCRRDGAVLGRLALRQLGAGAMPNLWDRLGEVRVPTLLIAGEADTRYVEVMTEMASLIPKAKLVVIRQAGHAIHREQVGELVREIYGFLG